MDDLLFRVVISPFKGALLLIRMKTFLLGVILLTCVVPFKAYPEGEHRLGINTTIRTIREEVKSIQELGAGTIRVPLDWQLVKIQPGEYDWSSSDRLVNVAQTRHVEVLFTIHTLFKPVKPKRPRQIRGPIYEISPERFDRKELVYFFGALAGRYRGRGVNYEIENEVNEGTLWGGTLAQYLELLQAGYEAIKKADPNAKVLPAAMRCGILQNSPSGWAGERAWKWHDGWLKPILSSKKFDVVNVHNYYFPSEITANGLTFRSYLQHIQDLMKESGLRDRPIWITETGFVSVPANTSGRIDDGSYDKQARWLTEAYEQALESGVEKVFWSILCDRKEPYLGSMGLVDANGDPRPAWNAFKQLTNGNETRSEPH